MKTVEQAGKFVKKYLCGKYVLEIACGRAEFSIMASKKAKKIECIDLDDTRLLPEVKWTDNITFQKMDAASLSFPGETFDTAVAYNAIGHLSNVVEKSLNESFRVLNKDGVLLIITNWLLDKTVINDNVIPFLTAHNKKFNVINKRKTLYLVINK